MNLTAAVVALGVGAIMLMSFESAYAADVQAGGFKFEQPSAMAPVTGRALEQMQQQIQGGARSLAERSGMADPQAAGGLGAAFFRAFRTADHKVTLAFMGQPAMGSTDLSEMLTSGRERVNWGIQNGQLRATSSVSRSNLGNTPCILQTIDHRNGARMRTWLCFATTGPKTQMTMSVICEDEVSCDRHRKDIDNVLATVRVSEK